MTPVQFKHEIGKDTTLLWIIIILSLILIWGVFFHLIEGHSRFDSVYFVIMTMTTVGYGDIVPTTIIGKVLTMIFALTWAPLFIFIAWFMVQQRITWLVKAYVKYHTSQMLKLKNEVDEISEDVEQITEEVEEITENVVEMHDEEHKRNT